MSAVRQPDGMGTWQLRAAGVEGWAPGRQRFVFAAVSLLGVLSLREFVRRI